ncbi:MAG TPA: TetR/AcrR family transcriptional regulator [Pseudonocardiaceae bacterium]|nr:TetR/AcrR family transcriptional regulator [Pseudonocardiaceae bacterium]
MARHTQEHRSRTTRAALVATARRLFAERGYADVPAAEIVSTAGLSRGALYHHYADKRDLFRAVFVELENELSAEIEAAAGSASDPAEAMVVGLDAYLSSCERDDIVRIVLTDGPAVLGWREWREIETEHGLGMISEMLEGAMAAGLMVRQPVRVLAQLLLSALIEAALLVADARDTDQRDAVRTEVRQGLLSLFAGLSVPTG